MKVAVVYDSITGNTKKLAEGVYNSISSDFEKALFELKNGCDIADYDVVVAAFWVDRSAPNKTMKDFISSLKNKKIFLLGTMGFFPDSEHGRDCIDRALELVDSSSEVIGYFICNGKINLQLLEKIQHMKASNPTEEAFKAHILDEKNLIRYKVLGEHTNDLDVEYASARVNERLLIEDQLSKIEN